MALTLVLIHHARAESEQFSLHWYVSKHHLLPNILPCGKKIESKLRRKGKLLQSLACKRGTDSEKSGVVALYYSTKVFQSRLGSRAKLG